LNPITLLLDITSLIPSILTV